MRFGNSDIYFVKNLKKTMTYHFMIVFFNKLAC